MVHATFRYPYNTRTWSLVLGLTLLLLGTGGQASAQVTDLYMFDYPGYVRCDSPSTYTIDVELHGTAATSNISLDFTYDSNLSFSSSSGDATSCTSSGNPRTCSFSPTSAGAWTLTQSFDFTISDCTTPYSGVLENNTIATWGASGSIGAREKGWAGDNGMDNMAGASYSCTAQDVKIRQLFIDRADITDGCVSATDDFVTGEMMADVLTNSTERFDIGLWVSVTGGSARTGTCATENLFDERIGLMTHDDVITPYLDPEGDGPYRNIDNKNDNPPGDNCGDTMSSDPSVLRSFGVRTMSCTDTNGDGYADAGYCVSWQNNANQGLCWFLEDAMPNTNSKCWCGTIEFSGGSGITVPNLSCTMDCGTATTVTAGSQVNCDVTFYNTGSGMAEYVRYKFEDDVSGASGNPGTFFPREYGRASTYTTGTFYADDDYFSDSSDSIITASTTTVGPGVNPLIWTPRQIAATVTTTGRGPVELPGEHAPAVTRTVSFTYTVGTGFTENDPITLSANTYWYNDNDPSFTGEDQQPLTCSYSLNFGPTWVHISDFSATLERGRVVASWETATEAGSRGFRLQRLDENGTWQSVHEGLLPALHYTPGGSYRVVDPAAPTDRKLEYRLVEVDSRGVSVPYGPWVVDPAQQIERRHREPMSSDFQAAKRAPSPATRARFAAAAAKTAPRLSRRVPRFKLGERAKIEIGESGLYRVDLSQLADALGMNALMIQMALRRNGISVSSGGNEVPWTPTEDGEAILFYGAALDSIYSDHNVYWIELESGTPMERVSAGAAPGSVASSYREQIHAEKDLLPSVWDASDPSEDYWYWFGVSSGSANSGSAELSFATPYAVSHGDMATLRLNLVALDYGSPRGEAELRLNGIDLGEVDWQHAGPVAAEFEIAPEYLADNNTLEVTGLRGLFWIDSVDVAYDRWLRTNADSLLVPGTNEKLTVAGFRNADIVVLELSDSGHTRLLRDVEIGTDPLDRSSWVSFQPPNPEAEYLAVSRRGQLSPTSISDVDRSNLRSSKNRAEYVILVPDGSFDDAADQLAHFHNKLGQSTMVVHLDDIMNEFNHGVFNPEAVSWFLAHAFSEWRTAPSFVALVGKGSYDYRDRLGAGGNLFPAIMRPTTNGLMASDNAFADVTGNDAIPEMAVGRIPVLSPAELEAYVMKLSSYLDEGGAGWTNRVLMVADNPDRGGDFINDSELLAREIPHDYYGRKIYLGEPYTSAEARTLVLDGLHSGAALMTYIGHSSVSNLAHEQLLRSSDVPKLENRSRLPIVGAFGCYLAYHASPGFASLGEELVIAPNGGAAAVWSSSSLNQNPRSTRLAGFFMDELFDGRRPVGSVVIDAMWRFANQGGDRDTLVTYNYLGDPGLRLVSTAR